MIAGTSIKFSMCDCVVIKSGQMIAGYLVRINQTFSEYLFVINEVFRYSVFYRLRARLISAVFLRIKAWLASEKCPCTKRQQTASELAPQRSRLTEFATPKRWSLGDEEPISGVQDENSEPCF